MNVRWGTVLWLLVAMAGTALGADERPPNVIIILADDMGYGDAGCYGGKLATPHLDRLAAEGMRFVDFHSSGPVCSPTRAGLLTGRYQQRAGIPGVVYADPRKNRHHGLHAQEITLPELLRDAGYATAIFGKWHLGYQQPFNPTRHGFETFRGFVSGNVDYLSHIDGTGVADWWHDEALAPEEGYSTHLINSAAVRFIEEHRDRPFFLYVAHAAVHSPYQAPGDRPVRAVGEQRIAGAARRDIARAYQQMMTEMDNGVGEILTALERTQLDHRTMLFFFSDNGATRHGSNGELRGFKGSLWEGGHRVPAVARWSGTIPPGAVSEITAISLDLMPTMLALAGVTAPQGHQLDGIDLSPTLMGQRQQRPAPLFWSYRQQAAVRDGDWKLVVTAEGRQLFHLADDRGETKNLAAAQPQRVERMSAALAAWKSEVEMGATEQPSRE